MTPMTPHQQIHIAITITALLMVLTYLLKQKRTTTKTTKRNTQTHTISHDNNLTAIYIQITNNKVTQTKEIHPGHVWTDHDKQGNITGVEILLP